MDFFLLHEVSPKNDLFLSLTFLTMNYFDLLKNVTWSFCLQLKFHLIEISNPYPDPFLNTEYPVQNKK